MNQGQRVVYAARSLPEAQEVCQALEAAGIRTTVLNESASDITFGFPKPVQVVVEDESADAARQVIRELGRETVEPEAPAQPWPTCPDCGAPRPARCRFCKTEATPSDGHDASSGELLFVCPTCDEPQEPQFVAQCPGCGHRFADGAEEEKRESFNPRVAMVIGTVVVLVLWVLVYLIALFHRS